MYGVVVAGRVQIGGTVSSWRDLWWLLQVVAWFW